MTARGRSATGAGGAGRKRGAAVPRAGVTTERIVEAATQIVDGEGVTALSLARLATVLAVKAPSLYAHVDGLPDVQRLLRLRAGQELLAAMQQAAVGLARAEALVALADAQRAYARLHPGLFAFTARVVPEDGDALRVVAEATLRVVLAVIGGYGLSGDDALHATRAVRAATRGFIELELAGGFGMPLQIDESWRRLLDVLHSGLMAAARTARGDVPSA